ncbi:MAG: protein-glutamate O-methyltransferase [Candidatus Riflebacteria bacterium]|nr:protein-glutamate O-methyltransferase [Candidatus Riflebacteria bacterium]
MDEQTQASSVGVIKEMTEADFRRLSEFIYRECGIKLEIGKKYLLQGRLQKRMRVLNLATYRDYSEYLFSTEGQQSELPHMIDAVTTNKTDFFREPDHFDYLIQKALPELIQKKEPQERRRTFIWSAGCSSGEEPYTLAMVLSEFKAVNQPFDFLVLATDISNTILEKARLGIYDESRVVPVPSAMKKKYLLRSKDRTSSMVRVAPDVRSKVKFAWLNFMEEFPIKDLFKVIFCRNVVIYFDRPTQEKLIQKFYRQLVPGGYLFMGHSETLTGLDVGFYQAAPTIYRKPL